jgi:hypothetical protein
VAKTEFLPARREHAEELAANMRPDDVQEVRRSHGHSPLEAVLHAMEESDFSVALLIDGQVAAVAGVAPFEKTGFLDDDVGCAWMLTSHVVNRKPKAFLRACEAGVDAFLKRYPVLANAVDAKYARALKWAEWLGFDVRAAVHHGPEGALFHPIVLRRSTWVPSSQRRAAV